MTMTILCKLTYILLNLLPLLISTLIPILSQEGRVRNSTKNRGKMNSQQEYEDYFT